MKKSIYSKNLILALAAVLLITLIIPMSAMAAENMTDEEIFEMADERPVPVPPVTAEEPYAEPVNPDAEVNQAEEVELGQESEAVVAAIAACGILFGGLGKLFL